MKIVLWLNVTLVREGKYFAEPRSELLRLCGVGSSEVGRKCGVVVEWYWQLNIEVLWGGGGYLS
jgi:hypothetical protein